MTLALTLYQDGLCACGKPLIIAHDEDSDGWYETRESVCQACAALDRKRDDDDGKPSPGMKTFVVYDPEGLRVSAPK